MARRPSAGWCSVLVIASTLALCAGTVDAGDRLPFTEEAVERGIDYYVIPSSPQAFGHCSAFVDLDGDGDPDVVTTGDISRRLGIFENDGSGFFTDRSGNYPVAIPASNGISAADYDADGDLDVYVASYGAANALLENVGDFHFIDVTADAGVGNTGASCGSAWGDYDLDGDLDLYVANRVTQGVSEVSNSFYQNQGDGTFVDIAVSLGMTQADAPDFQPVFFDKDVDGDLDLYVSTDKGYGPDFANHMWENIGGDFLDVTSASGTAANVNAMGVAVGDFSGNGRADLYITNTVEGNVLYLQTSIGGFVEAASPTGTRSFAVGWGTSFLDFDNNGWRDLFVVNEGAPNRLYVHDGAWPCSDLAPALALDNDGGGYGCSLADIDGDGDQDILLSNIWDRTRLFINHTGSQSNWLRLDVRGEGENVDAIGAFVQIHTVAGNQCAQVIAGQNYKAQNELTIHFGLGAVPVVSTMSVAWPGGSHRDFSRVPAGQRWKIHPPGRLGDADGNGAVVERDWKHFRGCWTGTDGVLVPGCEMMDFDGDWDVDWDDLLRFIPLHQPPPDPELRK